MDKRKPTYQLTEIKHLVSEKRFYLTGSASKTADLLGFTENKIQATILELTSQEFYKSVSEYRNYKVWQDVYKKSVGDLRLYIKLKIIEVKGKSVVIMSFKEDESISL